MKLIALAVSAISILAASSVIGDQPKESLTFTTKSGKVFNDAKLTRVAGDSITVTTSTGVARIQFEDMPAELAKKYGISAETAAESREYRAKREAAWRLEVKKVEGESGARIRVEGRVQSVTETGLLLSDAHWWPKDGIGIALPDGGAFVICNTRGLVDGESIDELLYPRGTFAYTTVLGARRKVKCFTTSLEGYCAYTRDHTSPPE